jgi:hypothetical protein
MFEMVEKIGGTLLYSDTDSVMFTFFDNKNHDKKIMDEFTIDSGIGNYSLDKFSHGYFHNLKMYVLGDNQKIVCKGISGDEQKLSFMNTGRATLSKPVKYRQSMMSVQGLQPNIWREFEKVDHKKFNKRILEKALNGVQMTRSIYIK